MHVMKWLFIYRRDLVVCYVFSHFFISSKCDFHIDAEIMIVKKRKKCKEIYASMV